MAGSWLGNGPANGGRPGPHPNGLAANRLARSIVPPAATKARRYQAVLQVVSGQLAGSERGSFEGHGLLDARLKSAISTTGQPTPTPKPLNP